MKKTTAKKNDNAYAKAAVAIVGGLILYILAGKIFYYSEYNNYTAGNADATTTMAIVIKIVGGGLVLLGMVIAFNAYQAKNK